MTKKKSPKIPMACLLCPEEDEDGIYDPFRHMEIVGLHVDGNGRHCLEHSRCGQSVQVGDIIRIKKTFVDNSDGTTEEALCCVAIKGGKEKCRVGFVPRFLQSTPMIQKYINKYLQVIEFFEESENSAKNAKSKEYGGVAGVVFLDEIPSIE